MVWRLWSVQSAGQPYMLGSPLTFGASASVCAFTRSLNHDGAILARGRRNP